MRYGNASRVGRRVRRGLRLIAHSPVWRRVATAHGAVGAALFAVLVVSALGAVGLAARAAWPGSQALSSCPIRLFSTTPPTCSPSGFASQPHAWSASAAALPTGFQDSVVLSGLTNPTTIRFAADGRVFVAEKGGVILVYASLTASTPTVFADLRAEVDDYWDRGLMGLALDPSFPANPYVYVLYTFDAPIGGTAPTWHDACPTPPGPTTDGCVVSGRLSRLTADSTGNVMVPGSEQVLLNAWCQQFPSHTMDDLEFGPDGALYATAGEGANFNVVDYGQFGSTYAGDQANPCGDPPAGVGGVETPPTAEGGALRAQSLQRALGEPVVLNGSLIRVDPATGAAMPDNPLAGNQDANAARTVAYGLRNPYRFAFRPGSNEIWIGNVGWDDWEAIDRVGNPTTAPVNDFGWPCYEGPAPESGYQAANLNICTRLYHTPGAVTPPYYAYHHDAQVVSGEACPTGSSAISGLAFYNGGSYPVSYNGALFFADYVRDCIWAMLPGSDGLPNPQTITTLESGAGSPVDLRIGPGGDLFYVDFGDGQVHRIAYFTGCQPPIAVASATPTSGSLPLTVTFDGTASSDPNGGTLTYAWDLNGDGTYDDSTAAQPVYTYTTSGLYNVRVRVTNSCGAASTSSAVQIAAGSAPPTATITAPTASTTWKVGDTIQFSGAATDPQDGTLPASALSWTIVMHHCASLTDCHIHLIQSLAGVANGTLTAPDHAYPSYLELRLTATDSLGLTTTTSVSIYPQTVTLNFANTPAGLQLAVNSASGTTPFSRTVIVGSTNSISAPSPQTLDASTYYGFAFWSDGGAQTHTVVAGSAPSTYTAAYAQLATTWYFAEGYTGGSFSEYLTLANPNPVAANVQVNYYLGNGSVVPKTYVVNPTARLTVNVNGEVGANQNVSLVVTADQPVVAERPMYFTYTGLAGYTIPGGSDVLGATALATSFDFGYLDTSSGHDTWLTILNQNASDMSVTVKYFAASGAETDRTHTVPAHSRGTIHVNGEGLPAGSYSALITLSAPGLVERPMYLKDGTTGYTGSTDVVGVAAPASAWYFAEGYSSSTFSERYIVSNPGTTTAAVTVTYLKSNGTTVSDTATIAPGAQHVFSANAKLGSGGVNNSAVVRAVDANNTSNPVNVLAERFISFQYGTIPGASDVLGTSAPSHLLQFAEGYTGGSFSEYLTIENPSPTQVATVRVTFLPQNGAAPTVRWYVVGPDSRFTLNTAKVMPGQSFSMSLQANQPIVAERPMYFSYGSLHQTGGTDVIGYQPVGS